MIIKRKPKSAVTELRAPPTSRMQSGRTRAMRAAAVATAGLAAAGLTLTAIFAYGASASTQLPWASGVYLPNATPASVAAFGTWRGAPVNVATVWPNRSSWSDITNPAWLYQLWKGAPETMAFGVAMLPENVPGVSLQACANGSYNSYWTQFGTNISASGRGKSIIRLGWEFNGNWYLWQATNPTVWAACWRQIVTSARTTAPGLQWDWNVNRGVSAGLADPTRAYPGDAYVNTIGVDSYDMWPGATSDANWQKQLNGTQGLNYWLAFAKAHGKKFTVPEWGNVMPGTVATGNHAGGDDPAYVNDMLGFFQANVAHLAWESNFQGTITDGAYGTGTRAPKAAAAYKAGF
jgi:Glycosyl hydrolase family 26